MTKHKCNCKAGIYFEDGSGRIKTCKHCKLFESNENARQAVASLLDVLDAEFKATEDVALAFERLTELRRENGRLRAVLKLISEGGDAIGTLTGARNLAQQTLRIT